MDDFKGFNFKNVDKMKEEEQGITEAFENFESELGDYTWFEDRILSFGRKPYMVILNLLLLTSFVLMAIAYIGYLSQDFTFVVSERTVNLNALKAVFVIALLFSMMLPVSFIAITGGAYRKRIPSIRFGIHLLRVYFSILFFVLIIGIVITSLLFIRLLFASFIFVLILGSISFGLFYFYVKILSRIIKFLEDLSNDFNTMNTTGKITIPDAEGLKPYFVGYLVLLLVGRIFSLFDGSNIIDAQLTSIIDSGALAVIQLVLSFFIITFTIYILDQFAVHFQISPYALAQQQKPERKRHYYDGYEDID